MAVHVDGSSSDRSGSSASSTIATAVCNHVFVPVTALQCLKHAGRDIVICGEGCVVKVVCSNDATTLSEARVFPDSGVIHGFRVEPTDGNKERSAVGFIAFGQKFFKVLELSCTDQSFNVSELSVLYNESDWILDVQWIHHDRVQKGFQVAVAFAHNQVLVFDSLNNTRRIITSEINCILYSARLRYVTADNEITLASGSVFNDVLISSCSLAALPLAPLPVSLLLKGHEGVIFGISFSEDCQHLVTVSDDRSVRTWSLPVDWREKRDHVIHCSNVFYGHTSRVWSAQWLSPSLIISVSEDASARLWDLGKKECVHIETGHKGCNIWSLAVDRNTGVVVTGGGDCGIHTFNFKRVASTSTGGRRSQFELHLPVATDAKAVSPRILCLLDDMRLLCLTDSGMVLEADLNRCLSLTAVDCSWKVFLEDAKFARYAVMSLSHRLPLVAMGSLEGLVKLVHVTNSSVQYMWKPFSGKVFSLTWLTKGHSSGVPSSQYLLGCGPGGQMVCWCVSTSNNSLSSPSISVSSGFLLSLPPSKHRWVTSGVHVYPSDPSYEKSPDPATTSVECIVCGDRKGSVFLYILDPAEGEESPVIMPTQSYTGIHGGDGVTSVCLWNGCVYTTGRDGYCRQFIIRRGNVGVASTHWELVAVNKFHPLRGVDWIERVVFTENHGLIAHAFHGNDFMIQSSSIGKPLVTIACGGGHRSSAVSSSAEIFRSKRVLFSFIKGSCVYVMCCCISDGVFRNVLKEPFLGREVTSLCNVGKDIEGSPVIAVGSEDCSIVLLSIGTKCSIINRLEEHISAVKALCSIPSGVAGGNGGTSLLFSAGGRASLKAWTVYTDTVGSPVHLCCEHNLHDLPSRPKRRGRRCAEVPPECRVVSLTSFSCSRVVKQATEGEVCVVAGCSDGVVRLYIYSELERIFHLIETIDYHERCVLTVDHVICHLTDSISHMINPPVILCTCATDGNIVLWDLGQLLLRNEYYDSQSDLPKEQKPQVPVCVLEKTHQSGINSVAIMTTPTSLATPTPSSSLLFIASVGDDNALVLHQCCVGVSSEELVVTIVDRVGVANAHHSTITGVSFLSPSHVMTSSVDQQLSLWNITKTDPQTNGTTVIEKMQSYKHNVADASSLLTYDNSKSSFCVLVGGVGLQHYTMAT